MRDQIPPRLAPVLCVLCVLCGASFPHAAEELPKWATAHKTAQPMTADQTRAFMKRLVRYVAENHLKTAQDSPQRGMVYEYFEPAKKGRHDQWVQGEALDTMHDGAWFGAALVTAYRATGDEEYKSLVADYLLPFYCKMLNHSDELFSAKVIHTRPDRRDVWKGGEWLFREGEKGFVPYWWDDGASVSLERVQKKSGEPEFPCFDQYLASGRPNPEYRLSGYSLGCSNHMAQDLGVLVQTAWLLFREDPKWAKELADAAKNLQQCRVNHGAGNIPAVVAPAALSSGDAKLLARLPEPDSEKLWKPDNHYTRAFHTFKAGQRYSMPGFADDQEYHYYAGIARAGGTLPKPLAFKLIYDAYTLPMMYRAYSDDAEAPPGVNVFDLHPYHVVDGKPVDRRSERKGPHRQPRPVGSRFGPQNMVVSGWAIQALRQSPGIWDEGRRRGNLFVEADEKQVLAALERELSLGLRTWEAVFDELGYVPTGMGEARWQRFSDSGGYAHLLKAASQWLMILEGKRDWELHRVRARA